MSQENVEVVRSIIAASEQWDFDAVFEKYDPELEWHIARVAPPMTDFEPVYYGTRRSPSLLAYLVRDLGDGELRVRQ